MNATKTENQGAGIGNREVQPEIREAEIENLPADQEPGDQKAEAESRVAEVSSLTRRIVRKSNVLEAALTPGLSRIRTI